MIPFQKTSRVLSTIAGSLLLVLLGDAVAVDAGEMNPRLPDEAILAAMRFQSFSRKAETKKAWEERHVELVKALEGMLEKAKVSDVRAATALRSLLKDVKDAKYVPRPKKPKVQQGEYPVLPNGYRVLVNKKFHINSAKTRVQTFPFEIKSVPAMIKVAIGGGSDDSGDKGLHYLVLDPIGRVIKRGFSDKDEYVWEEHLGTRSGTWKVIIEDLDTDIDEKKKSPGNQGAIEVLEKAE